MSIILNIKSPNKNELADVLESIAKLIKASKNQTVTINGEILFNERDE